MAGDPDIQRSDSRAGLFGSLLVHGILVALLLLVFGMQHVADPPRSPPTVDIVTIDPPPPVVISQGPYGGTKAAGMVFPIIDPAAGRSGKKGKATGPVIPNPPPAADPRDELVVSYDRGTELANGAGDHGTGPGRALYGNGYDGPPGNGVGGGAGGLGVPSLARPPSPREDYSQSSEKFPKQFAGNTVLVELQIDANGIVTHTTLVRGMGSSFVEGRVMDDIRDFKFWPALDDTGHPIPSHYRWLWVLQPD